MIQSPAGYQGDVRIKRYLDFYQAGYGVSMLSSGTTAFTPASLFAASEPGGWYDPSDLTTLYQDAAGTTPVTAVEQPVGLVLDKSRGLTYGAELISNGSFANGTTGWSAINSATIAASGGELTVTAGSGTGNTFGGAAQTITTVIGQRYFIVASMKTASKRIGTALSGAGGYPTTTSTSYVTLQFSFVASSTSSQIGVFFDNTAVNGDTFTVRSVSVRELPGSHLSQSTAAARPVLSARVNLLTRTEEFDNAAWSRAGLTAANTTATTDPLGGNTADILTSTGSPRALYVSFTGTVARYTASAYFKADTETQPTLFLVTLGNGLGGAATFNLTAVTYTVANYGSTTGTTATINAVGNGWYHCTVSVDLTAATYYYQVTLSSTPLSVYIWGADLRPANAGVGLPAYQRVGAATAGSSTAAGNADYDTTGFPLYLKFDGTDDRLITSTLSPGVDKAQIFVGLRKPNDTVAVAVEYGTNADSNTGAFYFVTGSNAGVLGTLNGYTAQGRGTSAGAAAQIQANGPDTAVVTMTHDIAGDLSAINRNGVAGSSATTDKGTGNFGSHVLHVGARNSAALWFAGNLYQLIVRFSAANLDAATITATETWVNQRTKAF